LPGKRRGCEVAGGHFFPPGEPVWRAAVAPHHPGAVVGVDLGEQCPACLLGRHVRILTADATAQRGGGDLVFHWALHQRGVAADLMAGPGVTFAERLKERVTVDGMLQERTQIRPGVLEDSMQIRVLELRERTPPAQR